LEIGFVNKLKVLKIDTHHVSLQSDSRAEIILQRNQFSDNCDVGDEINVFIYPDSYVIGYSHVPFQA